MLSFDAATEEVKGIETACPGLLENKEVLPGDYDGNV